MLVIAHKAGIGNAIEATPLIQAIRMLWPTSHLTVAVSSMDLFENWCVPDRIITSPEEIRGESFDYTFTAYLYENANAWKEYCTLGRIHSLKPWQKKWFLKTEREYYLGMLKPHGYKGKTPPCYVSINKPVKIPPDSTFRICIAPCGKNEDRWEYKKWPYYPELIHALRNRYPDGQICVVGTKNDGVDIEFDGLHVLDFRSVYSLSETAWLMKHSDWVIGNDCGPMHIADAVQARGIIIFGPTCVIKNGPKNKLTPLVADIACQPCQYSEKINECTDSLCIHQISVDMVLKLIERQKKILP